MYMWLYKEDLASGVKVRLDEVDEYIEQGWLDTPDKWGKEGVTPVDGWEAPVYAKDITKKAVALLLGEDEDCSLEDMDESALIIYAMESFKVKIDKRKSKANMIKQIEALENGN